MSPHGEFLSFKVNYDSLVPKVTMSSYSYPIKRHFIKFRMCSILIDPITIETQIFKELFIKIYQNLRSDFYLVNNYQFAYEPKILNSFIEYTSASKFEARCQSVKTIACEAKSSLRLASGVNKIESKIQTIRLA